MSIPRLVFLCVLAAACLGCGPKQPPIAPKLQDDFANILVMYHFAFGKHGEPARGVDALLGVDAKMQATLDSIRSGQLVVVWGTNVTRDAAKDSEVILAFEKDALTKGGYVQMVDVVTKKRMTADELKAALSKHPAWDDKRFAEKPSEVKPTEAAPEAKMTPEKLESLELHLLAGIYNRACVNRNRAPADYTDLEIGGANLPEHKGSVAGVRDGKYVCAFGVDTRMIQDKDRRILAWHKDVPIKGGRVVTVSGDVKPMTAAEFVTAPLLSRP